MSEPDTNCTPIMCNGQPFNASEYPTPQGNPLCPLLIHTEPDTSCTPIMCNGQPFNTSEYQTPQGEVIYSSV